MNIGLGGFLILAGFLTIVVSSAIMVGTEAVSEKVDLTSDEQRAWYAPFTSGLIVGIIIGFLLMVAGGFILVLDVTS